MYKIKLKDGRIESYDDIRELAAKYGDVIEYFRNTFQADLPEIYSGRYDTNVRWR